MRPRTYWARYLWDLMNMGPHIYGATKIWGPTFIGPHEWIMVGSARADRFFRSSDPPENQSSDPPGRIGTFGKKIGRIGTFSGGSGSLGRGVIFALLDSALFNDRLLMWQ